jgi:hypothetical protein
MAPHTQSTIAAAAHSVFLGLGPAPAGIIHASAAHGQFKYDIATIASWLSVCRLRFAYRHRCCSQLLQHFGCNRERSARQLSAHLSFTRMSGRTAEGSPGSLLRRIASCSELMRLNVGLPLSPPPAAVLPPAAAAAGEACPPGRTGGRSTDVKAFRWFCKPQAGKCVSMLWDDLAVGSVQQKVVAMVWYVSCCPYATVSCAALFSPWHALCVVGSASGIRYGG